MKIFEKIKNLFFNEDKEIEKFIEKKKDNPIEIKREKIELNNKIIYRFKISGDVSSPEELKGLKNFIKNEILKRNLEKIPNYKSFKIEEFYNGVDAIIEK